VHARECPPRRRWRTRRYEALLHDAHAVVPKLIDKRTRKEFRMSTATRKVVAKQRKIQAEQAARDRAARKS